MASVLKLNVINLFMECTVDLCRVTSFADFRRFGGCTMSRGGPGSSVFEMRLHQGPSDQNANLTKPGCAGTSVLKPKRKSAVASCSGSSASLPLHNNTCMCITASRQSDPIDHAVDQLGMLSRILCLECCRVNQLGLRLASGSLSALLSLYRYCGQLAGIF